jgi:hypothetical protein
MTNLLRLIGARAKYLKNRKIVCKYIRKRIDQSDSLFKRTAAEKSLAEVSCSARYANSKPRYSVEEEWRVRAPE